MKRVLQASCTNHHEHLLAGSKRRGNEVDELEKSFHNFDYRQPESFVNNKMLTWVLIYATMKSVMYKQIILEVLIPIPLRG
jgi:hypothetical protein